MTVEEDNNNNSNKEIKRIKASAEEGESKATDQNSTKNNNSTTTTTTNNNRETSADTSKENSKASEVQKPDYIHVRARRGQATDSHSLAERVSQKKHPISSSGLLSFSLICLFVMNLGIFSFDNQVNFWFHVG